MGNELAMFREWDERREPDWELLELPCEPERFTDRDSPIEIPLRTAE